MSMRDDQQQKSMALGFLTVDSDEREALRGGYLIVSDHGRPLEFHFTLPLSFTNQERVLYGRQFGKLVHVEQIAKPLTDRQSMAPRAIFVDRPTLLGLRECVPAPVLCVSGGGQIQPVNSQPTLPSVVFHPDFPSDALAFDKLRGLIGVSFDWLEPFERIRAALEATRQNGERMAA